MTLGSHYHPTEVSQPWMLLLMFHTKETSEMTFQDENGETSHLMLGIFFLSQLNCNQHSLFPGKCRWDTACWSGKSQREKKNNRLLLMFLYFTDKWWAHSVQFLRCIHEDILLLQFQVLDVWNCSTLLLWAFCPLCLQCPVLAGWTHGRAPEVEPAPE